MAKKSLKFKLITGSISAVLLPLLIIGTFSVIKSSNALLSAGESASMHVAEDLALMSNLYLESEVKFATAVASEDLIIKSTILAHEVGIDNAIADIKKVDESLLRLYKRVGKSYEGFVLANAKGDAISGNDGEKLRESKINISKRDYFKRSRDGEICISSPIRSMLTGNPIVVVSVPIETPSKEFAGIFLTILSLDALSDKIASVKLGETGYPFIIDKTGLTIVHPKKEYILDLNLASIKGMETIISDMRNGKKGVAEYHFKGDDKIAAYTPISITEWSLGVTQNKEEFLKASTAIRNVILIVGAMFLVLTVAGVYMFARSIVNPITNISSGLNKGAEQVATAAGEVSKASQTLAEGAAEQAAAIEESSSSLEEISSMTKNNADNAKEADALMRETINDVGNANGAMEKLALSMEEISRASKETSTIIKTIDDIAFQTNLLALNAAVEAARAGAAGAGFAVVADEVRNLAMRSAEAAKNTSEKIEGTVTSVSNGEELVSITSKALESVAQSSDKVGALVSEISKASSEQSNGIGQVNTGITQMNTVVQQNAATAEESASASEEMSAQAEQLNTYVGDLITLVMGNNSSTKFISKSVNLNNAASIKAYTSERRKTQTIQTQQINNVRKGVSPEEMIPFEDHDDLSDF